jgi:hypothetical protein
MVKSGQAVTVLFSTSNATTGALADADATPVGTLYVDGTANAATVTETNVSTGIYKAAVTLPALTAGQIVSLGIAATVAGVAGGGIVWQDVADTVHTSDVKTDTAAILADTGTDGVLLAAAYDAAKTAAQAGDAMTLTGDYDAAKTAAQAGDAMTLTNDAITAATFDETTAYPLTSADSGTTRIVRTGTTAGAMVLP